MAYYDGTKLLSMLDINGNKPEIYIVETNRSGGKTTYFGRLAINRFKDKGEKFALLYRYKYEVADAAKKFFSDIKGLFFQADEMEQKSIASGCATELFLNGASCGYAIAINSADSIKKYSHYFSDVSRIIFDEFQPESNQYCPNELTKFKSIHLSIARGQGKQVRYVPVYMISNAVTLLNPYYADMGISARLKSDTKFLRGNGFVLEHGYIETAAIAQAQSGFMQAFSHDSYADYATQNKYLLDSVAFVSCPGGKSKYLATLKYKDKSYAIREYAEEGVIFCDDKPDFTFPNKLSVTTADHDINYVMLRKNDFFLVTMRYFFEKGAFRFKNLQCKEAILAALSY